MGITLCTSCDATASTSSTLNFEFMKYSMPTLSGDMGQNILLLHSLLPLGDTGLKHAQVAMQPFTKVSLCFILNCEFRI